MPIDGYFPAIGFDGQGARDDFDRWMKFRSFQQQAVVYVAAENTPEALRYMAQFKCTGVDDDLVIQEAIDSLPADGGTVVLLVGQYALTQRTSTHILELGSSDITLEGTGEGTQLFADSTNSVAVSSWIRIAAIRCTLRNFQLSLNSRTQTETAIAINAESFLIDRLRVSAQSGTGTGVSATSGGGEIRGIDLNGVNGSGGTLLVASDKNVVTAVRQRGSTSNGGITVSGNDNLLSHIIVDGVSSSFPAKGLIISGDRNVLKGAVIETADTFGLTISGLDNNVSGLVVQAAGREGVIVSGDRNIVQAKVIGCSQETDDTYDGVSVTGDDNTILADVAHGGGSNQHQYGLSVAASALRNVILPGNLRLAGRTADLNDSGDGTRYSPGYQLDYAEITSDHALTGTEADITGLVTATFNATASAPRYVRVRAHFSSANDTAGARNKFNLKTTGGTYLDEQTIYHSAANDLYRCSMEWQGQITADTAWEVRGFEFTGNGKVAAATTWPAFIEVLDLGIMTT